MKKNLEEMQVKVANKRAILESHDGEEFSPITVAKNVLCEDGTTMQDYFDNHSEPNISTKIVNSNSMSKVGQGDNVDFSDNVMNGAYEDVVLKGKSLVNVIQGSSKDKVVLPYSFEEGERVTINDTHVNGRVEVEVRGKTLVNVNKMSYPTTWFANPDNNNYYRDNLTLRSGMVKSSTKYLLKIYGLSKPNEIRLQGVSGVFASSGNQWRFSVDGSLIVTTVVNVQEVENLTPHFKRDDVNNLTDKEMQDFKMIILEYQEGMENWDIPYFEGMASVQAPTVKSEQNLFEPNKVSRPSGFTYNETTNTARFEFTDRGDFIADTSITLPAGTYDLSYLVRGKCENGRTAITFRRDEQVWHGCTRIELDYIVTDSSSFKEVKKRLSFGEPVTVALVGHAWAGGALGSGWCEMRNIKFTPIDQSSSLTLPEEIVLRSLPNGVCDTYNTKTKEYVRRIGEIVLDGSDDEQWGYNEGGSIQGKKCFNLPWELTPNRKQYGYAICDHMPITTTLDKVGVYNGQGLNILIDSNSNDVGVLKEILASKPITVQYELATPIVTKINLLSLKAYNTITHLSSTVGEGSLVPTLASDNTISYPAILKPNTKYSIIAHKDRNNHSNHLNYTFDLGGATTTCSVNDTITTVTTPSTLSHQELRVKGQGLAISSIRVIEGEVAQDLPYFEGICDCKSPILLNCGKNISPINTYETTVWAYAQGYQGFDRVLVKNIMVDENETYMLTFDKECESGLPNHLGDIQVIFSNSPAPSNYTGHNAIYTHCQNNRGKRYAHITMPNIGAGSNYIGKKVTLTNIQLRESSTLATYEPYKSNTTTFTSNDDEIIVLRSLPNGTCDTLNVKTGEYVQRIGEFIADGDKDEVWELYNRENYSEWTTYQWKCKLTSLALGFSYKDQSSRAICDKLKFGTIGTDLEEDYEHYRGIGADSNGNSSHFYIWLNQTKASTVGELKTHLQQNPITIQYQLTTPITKTVDISGYPYAYKDGHVLLESGSQEQSLTPTIEYSIVANRGGQIRSNQRMVERHQKKLDSLYVMTLVNMIDSQYRQVLMKLKSELGSEVSSWDI